MTGTDDRPLIAAFLLGAVAGASVVWSAHQRRDILIVDHDGAAVNREEWR